MHKNRVTVFIVFIFIMFFILRYCTGIGSSIVETISSCILYPLLRVQCLIIEPITTWLARSTSGEDLEKKIENLQKKYDAIFAENSALKAMHHYAGETQELRDFNKKYSLHHGKLAQVLARHFSSNNQFFLVDAGDSQGIKKDMVALYGNTIVGRVAEVYPWYCKVCLITDVDCKIAALCLSCVAAKDRGVGGIHEGINDSSCTVLRYVSHLESVNVGDDVLSSGEGLIFPRGFALGKVIAAHKGELFYTIFVQPALDFQTLRYCTLIAKESII